MSAWELNKVTLSVKWDFKMIYICSSALLQHRELHYAQQTFSSVSLLQKQTVQSGSSLISASKES